MVIANLDNQVEKVFGLSVPQKRAEQMNQASDDKIVAASESASEATDENRVPLLHTIHYRKPVERLDDTELPVWLL